MNRRTTSLLLGILLTAALVVRADEFEHVRGTPTNQVSKINVGSAKRLLGKACLYHIFVSDADSPWTDDEKKTVRQRAAKAHKFLKQQADRYEQQVSFVCQWKSIAVESSISNDMFAHPRWTNEVIQVAAGATANDFVENLKRKHRVDQVLFVLHLNKSGRSYNLSYYDGIGDAYRAERVVCFASYPHGEATAAATIAHEVLHGFGAGELYYPYDANDKRRKQAEKLFPNDVMRRVEYDMSSLTIGPYTAYRIGWLDKIEDEHKVFDDE
jgi:hypothetical protein